MVSLNAATLAARAAAARRFLSEGPENAIIAFHPLHANPVAALPR
jgi:hypothetical protein